MFISYDGFMTDLSYGVGGVAVAAQTCSTSRLRPPTVVVALTVLD